MWLSLSDVYTVDSGIFGPSFPMVYITHGIDFCFVVCLDFIFFLKLADINTIFNFTITNSQQIFSPFPIGVLCENPIKVILKVTSPRLSLATHNYSGTIF